MDPGHHTAYLLAILICILLLLLAASALLMCYLRRNGLNVKNRKSSMRFGAAMRDTSTSMSSFALNFMDPKLPIYSDLNDPQAVPLPFTVHRSKPLTSPLSRDSHMLSISDDDEGTQTSGLESKSVRKKSDTSGQYSALRLMLSSGASILGGVLERSSMFSLKAKRRSSSLKSGINTDLLMVTLESPVHVSTSVAGAFQAAGLPKKLSSSSTLLCENSSDQQFTWDTADLSIQSDNLTQKETDIPSALERKPFIPEEDSVIKDMVQLRNPDFLEPKTLFVSIRNRPVSDGVQLEKKELNNVASLDSGVDTTGVLLRAGSGGLNTIPKVLSMHGTEKDVLLSSSKDPTKAGNSRHEMPVTEEAPEDCQELYITHQEAARKLNPGYYGRSLWEKREERPLIGVN
ncbi:uncharacterized protein LOC142740707 [Rhinoderma darwinii]|uniref:uncharacterized protein LOC142740707 n=1 Tax=Rhinoderma darwinii TaxID=43563 RepID=UPI003F681584